MGRDAAIVTLHTEEKDRELNRDTEYYMDRVLPEISGLINNMLKKYEGKKVKEINITPISMYSRRHDFEPIGDDRYGVSLTFEE